MVEKEASRSIGFKRSRTLFVLIIFVWAAFLSRLFYIQIIKHDYYNTLATESHERKFEIDAQRGQIYALDRDKQHAIALNENLPTVYADPRYVDDTQATANQVARILGGDPNSYLQLLEKDTAYVVLKKKTTLNIAAKIDEAEIKGVGTQDQYYRAYPEGALASQILGFVNADGEGQYGVEEYLDQRLQGTPGRVDAITDVRGVPLRGDDSNVLSDPKDGEDITLTIDINLQKQVEEAVEKAVKKGTAKSGSAIVIDPNSGAIKAMANYPSFDPANFGEVKDYSVFLNQVVTRAYEPGSVIKPLTMATGINEGAVTRKSTYYDAGYVTVDGRKIENAGTVGGVTRTMDNVIQKSVNTGIVHVLSELGGGQINTKARDTLYSYFTERFGLGALTNVEQADEAKGILADPDSGDGLNIRFANMCFGQGMTNTMLQVAAAISSIVNGGTYYKPYLVQTQQNENGQKIETDPVILRSNIIKKSTSDDIRAMMKLVVDDGGGRVAQRSGYKIGGKTGSAQVALSDGTYSKTREIGSFVGYVEGGDGVEYVIMTRVDEPHGYLYAGSGAAAPLFADISNWLIDYARIPPVD